jgi:non-homologous end joining protein Ku
MARAIWLARKKAQGEKVVLPAGPVSPAPVVDLMDALRASVDQARSRRKSA